MVRPPLTMTNELEVIMCEEPGHNEFLEQIESRCAAWSAEGETPRDTADRLGLDLDAVCCAVGHIDWVGMHSQGAGVDLGPLSAIISAATADLNSFIFATAFMHGISWERERILRERVG